MAGLRAAAPPAPRGCRRDRSAPTAGLLRSWRNSFQTVMRSGVVMPSPPQGMSAIATGRPPSSRRADRGEHQGQAAQVVLGTADRPRAAGRPAPMRRRRRARPCGPCSGIAGKPRAFGAPLRPVERQAIELVALLEGAAEGELDRARRCRRCASGRRRAWSARARSSCRGSSRSCLWRSGSWRAPPGGP